MSFLQLEPVVFANILSATNSLEDIQNLSVTCKALHAFVQTVSDVIKLNPAAYQATFLQQIYKIAEGSGFNNGFIEPADMNLPVPALVTEQRPYITTKHSVTAEEPFIRYLDLPKPAAITSIRVTGAKMIYFEIEPRISLQIPSTASRLLCDANGTVELLHFLKYLPLSKHCRIALHCIERHCFGDPVHMTIQWQCLKEPMTSCKYLYDQVATAFSHKTTGGLEDLVYLHLTLPMRGMAVTVTSGSMLLTDCVKTFELVLEGITWGKMPGWACRDLSKWPNSYWIPLDPTVDIFRTDSQSQNLRLTYFAPLPADTCVDVVYLNVNIAEWDGYQLQSLLY